MPPRATAILQSLPDRVPAERRFRFARIPLRDDVPIATAGRNGLSHQIAETLWQVLYPDLPGGQTGRLCAAQSGRLSGMCRVWGDRGIAIAYKPDERKQAQSEPDP